MDNLRLKQKLNIFGIFETLIGVVCVRETKVFEKFCVCVCWAGIGDIFGDLLVTSDTKPLAMIQSVNHVTPHFIHQVKAICFQNISFIIKQRCCMHSTYTSRRSLMEVKNNWMWMVEMLNFLRTKNAVNIWCWKYWNCKLFENSVCIFWG